MATYRREQIAPHPLRTAFLPTTEGEHFLFDQTSVENYLTNLILRDTLCEKVVGARLSRWATNIKKIRHANRPGRWPVGFDLRPREEPDLAKEAAVKAAQTVGIYVEPHAFEKFVAKPAALVLELVLTPFVSRPVSMGLSAGKHALEYLGVGAEDLRRKAARVICGRRRRLSKLAESPPGCISTYKQVVSTQEDLCGTLSNV